MARKQVARSLPDGWDVDIRFATNGKEGIEAMLGVKHPFSAFWRWQYLNDSFLKQKYPDSFDKICKFPGKSKIILKDNIYQVVQPPKNTPYKIKMKLNYV